MTQQINDAGLAILKSSEGCRLTAYQDGAGIWTIGWGHTGPVVHPGLKWTQAQADATLLLDLADTQAGVARFAPVTTANQFSALVSFAYNEGLGRLRGSSLLKSHNLKHYVSAKEEFAVWVIVDGEPSNGLIKRRALEAALYSS